MIHAKHRSWHPKTVNLKTFFPKLTFKNRYIASKNGSIGRLFVTPPLSEIGKKIGKMLKYTPTFKVLSAPLDIWMIMQQDTRAGLPNFFSVTLSHTVPRHCTNCRGLVLRAMECVSPAEAVQIHSLVTRRLASGGDRTRDLCA